jgi:TatD DNase family protein
LAFIDVHCHLDRLEHSPEVSMQEAANAGVDRVIHIGTEPSDYERALSLAQKLYPKVYCSLGLHPHEAQLWKKEIGDQFRLWSKQPYFVALGEMGLDYFYIHSPREPQIQAFNDQLDLAVELKLPIEIHTRDAEADTIAALKQYRGKVTGLIHCFTGSKELAEVALDVGFNISFSGIVSFKKAQSLKDVCAYVPLDRMHVETDAPFLAPEPHRGKKNAPALMIHTAKIVAEIKKIKLEDLERATNENALRLFPKLTPQILN